MTEYKDALEYLKGAMFYPYPTKNKTLRACIPDDIFSDIERALRITDRLMMEPSDRMKGAGENWHDSLDVPCYHCVGVFKDMRDQMLKELDDDQ